MRTWEKAAVRTPTGETTGGSCPAALGAGTSGPRLRTDPPLSRHPRRCYAAELTTTVML